MHRFTFKNEVLRKNCTVSTHFPELLGAFVGLCAARDNNSDPEVVFGSAIMTARRLGLCSVEVEP